MSGPTTSAAERLFETWFGEDLDDPEAVGRRPGVAGPPGPPIEARR